MRRQYNRVQRGWFREQMHKAAIFWIIVIFSPTICMGAIRLAPILFAIEAVLLAAWFIHRRITNRK